MGGRAASEARAEPGCSGATVRPPGLTHSQRDRSSRARDRRALRQAGAGVVDDTTAAGKIHAVRSEDHEIVHVGSVAKVIVRFG